MPSLLATRYALRRPSQKKGNSGAQCNNKQHTVGGLDHGKVDVQQSNLWKEHLRKCLKSSQSKSSAEERVENSLWKGQSSYNEYGCGDSEKFTALQNS